MNNLFIDDLVERLEDEFESVKVCTQKEVKSLLMEMRMCDKFPMICYEYTEDSGFMTDISESKFLTDSIHSGTWIVCINDDIIECIINLNSYNGNLEIDTMEINEDKRGFGLGSNVVSIVESVAETYYKTMMVSPYDTSAINFWEHMEYSEWRNGYIFKRL